MWALDNSYSGYSYTNWIFLGRNVDRTFQCSILWISLIPTQIKNTNTPTANQEAEALWRNIERNAMWKSIHDAQEEVHAIHRKKHNAQEADTMDKMWSKRSCVRVKNDKTTWTEEMQWSNRRYRSLMKQHKHVEATPETRCVENLQLQEKKQHNDSIGRTERQKLNSLVHSTLGQKGHFGSERSERKKKPRKKRGSSLHRSRFRPFSCA
jgi:hypothetical protein